VDTPTIELPQVEPLPRGPYQAAETLQRHLRVWPGPRFICRVCGVPWPCMYRLTALRIQGDDTEWPGCYDYEGL
jgi:hypothetical protein